MPLPLSPPLRLTPAQPLLRHPAHTNADGIAGTPGWLGPLVWHVPHRRREPACSAPPPSYISRDFAGISSSSRFLTWLLCILWFGSSGSPALSKPPTAACRPSPLPFASTFGCLDPLCLYCSILPPHPPPCRQGREAPPLPPMWGGNSAGTWYDSQHHRVGDKVLTKALERYL